MIKWDVVYLEEAEEDFKKLDGSQKKLVRKALEKIASNPLSINEGGYGKPLGNKNNNDLSGFLKVKLKSAGIRIVYKVVKTENSMTVIVIGAREDNEVYDIAKKIADKLKL